MICCLASAACPLRDTAALLAACGGRKASVPSMMPVSTSAITARWISWRPPEPWRSSRPTCAARARRKRKRPSRRCGRPPAAGAEMRLHVVYGPQCRTRSAAPLGGRRERAGLWRRRHVPCLTPGCEPGHDHKTCHRGREGAEVSFPLFSLRKAVTEDTRQRRKGAGHDYPDMRHAVCCSGAQPVRMKARMGIGKPPVTPGTVPRTGTKDRTKGKGGERRRKSGKARPIESAPGRLSADARPAKAHNEKKACNFRCKPLDSLVPRDRIELPTRGFSVPCSTN